MQSTWYRRPEQDAPRDISPEADNGEGRGRERGRGRGNDSGRARSAQEPRSASAPYPMRPISQYPPMRATYSMHPYYYNSYNSSGFEELSPHWQYVSNHVLRHSYQRNFNQRPIQNIPEFPRFSRKRAAQVGHLPNSQHTQEYLQQFMNIGFTYPTDPAQANNSSFQQTSEFPHPTNQQPAYSDYKKKTSKGHQQLTDKRIGQMTISSEAGGSVTIQKLKSQDFPISSLTNNASSPTPEIQKHSNMHRKLPIDPPESLKSSNIAVTLNIEPPQAHNTFAETAAFLNHPQLAFQQIKDLSPGYVAHPSNAKITPEILMESNIRSTVNIDPPQAHHTQATVLKNHKESWGIHRTNLLSNEKIQDLSNKNSTNMTHDCRKYSELTLPMDPPPAHQNLARAEESQKYLDMHTPPLAHQAPVSHILDYPQPAKILATHLPSPPPAHQATSTPIIHHIYQNQTDNLEIICHEQATKPVSVQSTPNSAMRTIEEHISLNKSEVASIAHPKRQHNNGKSTNKTTDGVLSAPNAVNVPHKMLGETQLVYQPSTETFASEQVLYQPQIDMFTKEHIVYQPAKKMLATTQVIYQPGTDFFATAETVYQPDIVAARETVVQPQVGMMKTAAALYNTQDNSMYMQHPKADIVGTMEALNHQQAEIFAARQTSYEPRTESEAHNQHVYTKRRNQVETYMPNTYQGTYAMSCQDLVNRKLDEITKIRATATLQNILSNQQAFYESQQSQREMAILQQLLLENYIKNLQNSTNSAVDIANLVESISSRQLVGMESMGSSAAQSANDIQSMVALNWIVQSLRNTAGTTHSVVFNNLNGNCSHTTNTKHENN